MEEFIPPPEAPVFQPTLEEFKDPVVYISKIWPVVVNTGICKIRPPAGWKPPFAVDVETFTFTPRIQPLNELEAKTRVKLNFLENLAKFWELQGIVFKIPNVDRHPLDLHGLFKVVTSMGGYAEVCRLRKWASVAKELSYCYVTVSGSLKANYERYLYPYELFEIKNNKLQEETDSSVGSGTGGGAGTGSGGGEEVHQVQSPVPQRSSANSVKYKLRQKRRRTRSSAEDPVDAVELDMTNPEFKKLAFTAPGPKNSFAPVKQDNYRRVSKQREPQCTLIVKSEPIVTSDCTSARTHPPLVPSQRYMSARTDPPSMRNISSPDSIPNGTEMEHDGCAPTADYTGTVNVKVEPGLESGMQSEGGYVPVPVPVPEDQSVPAFVESSKVEKEPELTSRRERVFRCRPELRDDPIDAVKCVVCGSGDCDDELLLCDGCEISYHMFCLEPPLSILPPGDWRCPCCVAEECNKPQDAFGFEQAEKQYTLRTFGEMANSFKQDYFGRSPHDVPYSAVEREFWRLVSSIEDEVVVEYGADLHTSKVGSGFPWETTVSGPEQAKYANSLWNLNRIPNADGCVLKYIDADISGMKVPWAYVGMCFSCFCWHIEDHWSYSINYLHWGEPKTWYGVPSAYAESLEATMKEQAPELFENHPDLMHDLVTTLSPNVLMKNGIPVVRTDQCAGEFVVTFPRAYHAGFNQGFNFAEAVNFSLADWISMGRASIDHYQSFNRTPVFSHDELICKMMATASNLDLCLLAPTCKDAAFMVKKEMDLRECLASKGYTREQRELFEIVKDEDRQCSVCNTYCFLSAVKCFCQQRKLACPRHFERLCECPPSQKVIKYRYTLPELEGMLSSLAAQAAAYTSWVDRVEAVLDSPDSSKTELQVLKDLLAEATSRGFTSSEIYDELTVTLQDVQKCIDTAAQIVSGRLRGKGAGGKMVDVGGLKSFLQEVQALPCHLPQANALRAKLADIEAYQREAGSALVDETTPDSAYLEELIKRGETFEVFVPEIKALKVALQQSTWMSETITRLEGDRLTIDTLKTMVKLGSNLSRGSASVEATLARVRGLLATALDWDHKAKEALKQKPPRPVEYFTSLLEEADTIPVVLQVKNTISEALIKADNWGAEARNLVECDGHPQYNILKALLEIGRSLPVKLEPIPQLESCYNAAKTWFDRASRAFVKKGSPQSLLEVLLPRNKASCSLRHVNKGIRKRVETEFTDCDNPLTDVLGDREKEISKIHEIEEMEKTFIIEVRNENTQKMEQDEATKGGKSSAPPVVYCFCQKPESGYMLQCELCHEWYHGTCLRLPKGRQGTESKWTRFLCSYCQRTRRPRLDTIVSLLIALQKVPVAFTEGIALQCLAERAIAWQKRARQSIANITMSIEASRTQQKRIQEIKGHICKWRNEAKSEQTGPTDSIQAQQLASSAGSVLIHYETELERLTAKYAGLNSVKRSTLDTLLMEGDLLEVNMDEVQQLWQLLQQDAHLLSAFQKKGNMEIEPSAAEEQDKRRRRKRKELSPALSTSSTTSSDAKPPGIKKLRRKPPKNNPKSIRKSRAQSAGSASSNDGLECSEDVEEEEGECSATKCRQPVAEEISWVQCDSCQGWFHCLCVGVTKEVAEKIESYCCITCKSGSILKSTLQNSISVTTSPGKRRGMLELQRALQNTLSNSKT